MTMKELRQYIRQILLTEGRKYAGDLPPMCKVLIERDGSDYARISVVRRYGDEWEELDFDEGENYGYMEMEIVKASEGGLNCNDGWMVLYSKASPTWGPLLYDIAMEWATINGGGLFPDRTTVSRDAYNVWEYYMNNRADVEVIQLDDEDDSFKNGPADDCEQGTAREYAKKLNHKWTDDPLSKLYRKPQPESIEHLKMDDKLMLTGEP